MKTKLQKLRKAAGYKSAKAFAEHMGMNPGTYTAYEQGRRPLTFDIAWKIADELHCSLDELAGRDFKRASDLTPAESTLLNSYRNADERGRKSISLVASVQSDNDIASEIKKAFAKKYVRRRPGSNRLYRGR